MPVAGQMWNVTAIHGRVGRPGRKQTVDVQVEPNSDDLRVTMALCALIGSALSDLKIDKAEIDDEYSLVILVGRKR